MKKLFLRCVGMSLTAGILIPGTAFAQAATTAPDAAAQQAQEQTPSASSAGATADIIVTAQRRSERLRDVPISITALSQERLIAAGVNTTVDLQRVTPGVQLPFFGGFLQPAIRGISSAGAGLGDSSNVAVYIDGIYQPSEVGQLLDLPDVENVQILKGPQGTLYGQNAAGGAIIVNTISPSFDLRGRLSASYGNYDDKAFRGYVAGPIVDDKVAVSLAGSYEDRDGFRYDVASGKRSPGLNSKVVRGKILLKPTESLSLTFGAYYTHRKDYDVGDSRPIGPGTPLGYALADAYGLTIPKPTKANQYAENENALVDTRTYGFNMLGKLDTGIGTFSTVTAYGNVKLNDIYDADFTAVEIGSSLPLVIKHHDFTQELNFTSRQFGKLNVSAGLFYLGLKEQYDPNVFDLYFLQFGDPLTVYPNHGVPEFMINQFAYNRKRSFAGYLELAYALSDKLNLTIGGRYSHETQRTADNHSALLGPAAGPLIPDPRGGVHFSRFTPRVTLRYALNNSSNVYFTYSQGFKSGYVNSGDDPFVTPLIKPVQPEKVFAYEVGYKGRIAHGVSLNIAAFYYDYKDLQVYVYAPPTEFYQNAASARIKGIDGDVTIDLARNLVLTAGGSYLDAHYVKFPGAVSYVPNAAGFGYDLLAIDASGNRLPRAPKLSGNVSLNYQVDTGAGRFGAIVSGTYNSGITYDPANEISQRRYALLDTELSFSPEALKGLRLVVWGKNLTNKAYLSSVEENNYGIGATDNDPRTYGVRAELAF